MPEQNPNQQTQVQNQQTQQTSNSAFDIHNLPPEFQRYLDQERTRASNTARANARQELMNDQSFLDEVRTSLRPQVEKTIEQQVADLRRETNIDRASAKVERILAKANISEEDMGVYMGMLVTEDVDASVQRANDFVSAFNKSVEDRVSKQQKNQMQSMTTPTSSGQTVTEQDRLQSKYDLAKKDTSPRRGAKLSAILREAQEKGITLK